MAIYADAKEVRADAADAPRGWEPAFLMQRVRGRAWALVCPSLRCQGVSKGRPYVPCLRARADRKVGLTLDKRSAWLILPMLRNSDAGLRF